MKHLLTILILFFLLIPGLSHAAPACCKVTTDILATGSIQTVYINLEKEDCERRQGPYTRTVFMGGQLASDDGKSCSDTVAQPEDNGPSKPIPPVLAVSIPGMGKFSDVTCDETDPDCGIPWIGEYIKAIYNYGLIVIGIISVIVMMIGGVMRITSGGNKEQIGRGNNFIKSSFLGITLAVCSYLILFLVNPNLTILKPIDIKYVAEKDIPEGEPIDIAVFENSPQASNFSLDQSSWQEIPKSPGVCMNSGARAAPQFIEKLKVAGACLNAKNSSWCISGTAARDVSNQERLYKQNCSGGTCHPPTCNPYPLGQKICPHTSGSAADLNRHVSFYTDASKCLAAAGFCRLCSEEWHWEYPKMSSGCTCN